MAWTPPAKRNSLLTSSEDTWVYDEAVPPVPNANVRPLPPQVAGEDAGDPLIESQVTLPLKTVVGVL